MKKASIFDLSGSFEGLSEGYSTALLEGLYRATGNMDDYLSELFGTSSSYGSVYSTRERTSESAGGTRIYNFYSNEALTPAEISRQFKKTEQDLALGF